MIWRHVLLLGRKVLGVRPLVSALLAAGLVGVACRAADGQIPRPNDAPRPLAPGESAGTVRLPDGFALRLIAAEPLVREPAGVCWDAGGRLFVCELHGYNLEGQYDIEELNKTGQLDRVVRRIQANAQAKAAAEAGTYGTVKRLADEDGDGRLDTAYVWADDLPPCYGICPAADGVIVACAPHIVFLADRDNDGRAEVRETLFTGFETGPLERGISCPQWGSDGWIYCGRGAGGGTITGPRLKTPVVLPRTDFRFRADGSAIEPVSGGTHTFGFAITEFGDRFVVSTATPGLFVAPLPWRYLARNPNVSAPDLVVNASDDQRVYPVSEPHPWRTRRAEDPGFAKYYTDRYGHTESAPNGFFTSCCSPLVYQDDALPGLTGHLLACEPAQNFVHRAVIDWQQLVPRLRRPAAERQSEFLAAADRWFHPMALRHAPDGSVAIVDFYREIIEDYSAIPRYLQQIYGLNNGQDYGRVWQLVHRDTQGAGSADMQSLGSLELVRELDSPRYWRRATAQRLLFERRDQTTRAALLELVQSDARPAAVVRGLYVLEHLNLLTAECLGATLRHGDPRVRVHALRLAEPFLRERDDAVMDVVFALAADDQQPPRVTLQLALSLGEVGHTDRRQDAGERAVSADRVETALGELLLRDGDVPWLANAILSSCHERAGAMLRALLRHAEQETPDTRVLEFVRLLGASLGAGRDGAEIGRALVDAREASSWRLQQAMLAGMRGSFSRPVAVGVNEDGRGALVALVEHHDRAEVRQLARELIVVLRAETAAQRRARVDEAIAQIEDITLPVAPRLDAVAMLAQESDARVTAALLDAFTGSTPQVRQAILDAVFADSERLVAVVAAMERGAVPPAALSAVQRAALREHAVDAIRERAERILAGLVTVDDHVFQRYRDALQRDRDVHRGQRIFAEKCATCHRAHGLGTTVGPDLSAEFRRVEETIVKDILFPSETIAAGYTTYVGETRDGRVISGVLADESATAVTLRQPEGKQVALLRKDIETLSPLNVSLMPDDLTTSLTAYDVACVVSWLRMPPLRRVLFDDDSGFVVALEEGSGEATLETTDVHAGQYALRVTPPQRYSARIDGWNFPIREEPGPGEYRYLRLAWKSAGAAGVMVEIANAGAWPAATDARWRYYAGSNTTAWNARQVSAAVPEDWQEIVVDLWADCGDGAITGIAPTAMGGPALFDSIELSREK